MSKIELIQRDITTLSFDAIVNAANSSLMGGGGVDGAIHRAGGPAILEACKIHVAKHGPCRTGEAVLTTAGYLPSKFVIHTVGPVWQGGIKNESQLLSNCYKNSLMIAGQNNLESIAFPNISTGIYGFPKKEAAAIALQTVTELVNKFNHLRLICFVCFDKENYDLYRQLLS